MLIIFLFLFYSHCFNFLVQVFIIYMDHRPGVTLAGPLADRCMSFNPFSSHQMISLSCLEEQITHLYNTFQRLQSSCVCLQILTHETCRVLYVRPLGYIPWTFLISPWIAPQSMLPSHVRLPRLTNS